jgi:hypothetical protein
MISVIPKFDEEPFFYKLFKNLAQNGSMRIKIRENRDACIFPVLWIRIRDPEKNPRNTARKVPLIGSGSATLVVVGTGTV